MDNAEARRRLAMLFYGADELNDALNALTDEQVGEGVRLREALDYAKWMERKAPLKELVELMEQSEQCYLRWVQFVERHGLMPIHKKRCEYCGLRFVPIADERTCSPACQAARYPKRIRDLG